MINQFIEWHIISEGEDYIAFAQLVFVVVGEMFAIIKWSSESNTYPHYLSF